MDSQAIATWAEKQAKPAHTPKYDRITRDDLEVMRAMHKAGKPQDEIAQAVGCSQGTVSKWLRTLTDTTDIAKEYLRGSALRMAKNVVKNGQARDHIQALKGLRVLEDDGHDTKIAIGIHLPGLGFASETQTVSAVIHSVTDATGSDNNKLC